MKIDNKQFEKYADEFAEKYPIYNIEAATKAMSEMADFHLGMMPEYPESTGERLLPPDGVSFLKSDKQKAWFFASVRKGDLPGWQWIDGHPQKTGSNRTGNLGRAQGRDIVVEETSVTGVLGFDPAVAPYAPWVVGDDYPGELIAGKEMYQARVHVDRWWQNSVIIAENEEEGWQLFEQTFWEEFSKKVNGVT